MEYSSIKKELSLFICYFIHGPEDLYIKNPGNKSI